MKTKPNSYDEKCFELAQHFFPEQSFSFLDALAQSFQDCVEGREALMVCEPLAHIFMAQGEPCKCGAVKWGQPSNTPVAQ